MKELITIQIGNLGYDVTFTAHDQKSANRYKAKAKANGRNIAQQMVEEMFVSLPYCDLSGPITD
jgi:hypothetical protein